MALTAVEQQIAAVAQRLGVDPRLAIATASVESGLNPGAIGDQGTSFGLFQLHQGGELGSLTPSQAFDPTTNASVALRQFAAVEAAHPGVTDPGTIAALAQRPANPTAYAAAVDKAYGGLGAVTDALTQFGTQCVQFVEAVFAGLPGFRTPSAPGGGLVGTAAQYAGSGPGSLGSMGWGELAPSTAALGVEPGDIIVAQPGALGSGPAGHVVAVSGLEQGGGVQIVQSNAPEGTGPTVSNLTAAELGAPGVSVWHPPAAEQQQAGALAQGAAAQLGGGAPSGPTQATLADYQLASATSGPGFSWWDPRAWIDAVAGTAGNVAGTAAGAAAGAAAGGIVTGVAAASQGFFASAVRPWFDKNVVPLATGVVIVLIVFGGPQRVVQDVQFTRAPAEPEGNGEEPAPSSTEPAGGGSSYFREIAGAGEKAAPAAAAAV